MTVLVAGADRVDAGKTTFSVGLLARTGGTGFKPRAGNDYWHDHDDVRRATGDGRLYGKDAARLVAASGGHDPPEAVNPVHRLWQPSPAGGSGLLGQDHREFLVDRVGDEFVVNGAASIPDDVAAALPLEDAPTVDSVDAFNDLMRRLHLPAVDALATEIEDADRAVVESYADVARPVSGIEPTAVAVVEPMRVRVYEGDRYWRACQVASGGPDVGQLEERVSAVTDLVDPVETVSLPALGSDERADPDRVARAYDPAYETVLDVVDW